VTVPDRGLAAARTTLAWRRSGISVVAIGLAIARGVPTVDGVPSRPWLGLVVGALGGICFAAGSIEARRRAGHTGTDRPTAGLTDLLPVTLAAACTAIGAAAVVLVAR
jgi:uncharacterized membrane protein YidH (DUF202 family)